MLAYIVRRMLLLVPTFIGITFIGFAIIHLAPGDPVELFFAGGLAAGQTGISTQRLADVEKAKAELRHELGLDQPIPVQYARWVGRLVRADLGTSLKDRQPVWDKIRPRLPVTITIAVISLLIMYAIAIPLGIYSAVRPEQPPRSVPHRGDLHAVLAAELLARRALDRVLLRRRLLRVVPARRLRSLDYSADWPLGRRLGDLSYHLILPIFVTTLGSYTELSRYMRSAMLENARQDFIRTARAKGVPERTVILKHMLRNSLIAMVTIVAGVLPGLIGGSVIIEKMFSIPGIGQLGYQAVLARDYPVVLALFAASSFLTLVGILLADLVLALVDPRISFGKANA